MSRPSEIRYYDTRKAYYTQIHGKQHLLAKGPKDGLSGPTYKAAYAEYLRLVRKSDIEECPVWAKVSEIIPLFLERVKQKRSNGTYRMRERHCLSFAEMHGDLQYHELKHEHVDSWLASGARSAWASGTARIAIHSLQAAFNWYARNRKITLHPLADYEVPAAHSRSRECLISEDQHKAALKAASPYFREILIALENTGARPGEIASASAHDWDDSLGALTYHTDSTRKDGEFRHKTAGKGKTRLILFTGNALAMMRDLVKLHPSGLLFRTQTGKRWGRETLSTCARMLRQKINNPNFILYGYRHTFATNWLKAGKSIEILADLLGNSVEVLREHYKHLLAYPCSLRAQLEDFRKGQQSS